MGSSGRLERRPVGRVSRVSRMVRAGWLSGAAVLAQMKSCSLQAGFEPWAAVGLFSVHAVDSSRVVPRV
jgi:hypothetical protein